MKTAIFGQFYNFRSGVFGRNGQKAHLRIKTFHLSLARISSSLEKPLFFFAILANFTTSGRVFLTEMVKRHIYGPRPFM